MKKESKVLTALIAVSMAIMTSCGSDNSSSESASTTTGKKMNPANVATQAQSESQIDTETMDYSPAEQNSIVISDDLKQSEIKVGDIVVFGDYTWNVINETDDGYTLLCEKCITQNAYDTDGDNLWSKSSLREWLNNDFYNEFSDEEKAMIRRTYIDKTDKSPSTMLAPNTDFETWDFIFLLNREEAELLSEDVRTEGSWWWLRTFRDSYSVMGVMEDGSISSLGNLVEYSCGVRPALNLTRKKQQEQQEEISNSLRNSTEEMLLFSELILGL